MFITHSQTEHTTENKNIIEYFSFCKHRSNLFLPHCRCESGKGAKNVSICEGIWCLVGVCKTHWKDPSCDDVSLNAFGIHLGVKKSLNLFYVIWTDFFYMLMMTIILCRFYSNLLTTDNVSYKKYNKNINFYTFLLLYPFFTLS